MSKKNNNDDYIYELLNYSNIEDDVEADNLDELTAKRIKVKIEKKSKERNLYHLRQRLQY